MATLVTGWTNEEFVVFGREIFLFSKKLTTHLSTSEVKNGWSYILPFVPPRHVQRQPYIM
jgi:hypothetical protein